MTNESSQQQQKKTHSNTKFWVHIVAKPFIQTQTPLLLFLPLFLLHTHTPCTQRTLVNLALINYPNTKERKRAPQHFFFVCQGKGGAATATASGSNEQKKNFFTLLYNLISYLMQFHSHFGMSEKAICARVLFRYPVAIHTLHYRALLNNKWNELKWSDFPLRSQLHTFFPSFFSVFICVCVLGKHTVLSNKRLDKVKRI